MTTPLELAKEVLEVGTEGHYYTNDEVTLAAEVVRLTAALEEVQRIHDECCADSGHNMCYHQARMAQATALAHDREDR